MIRVSTITPFFRGERFLKKFFQNVQEQTIFGEFEVVLVHNEPTESEFEIINDFGTRFPDSIKHIIVNPDKTDFLPIKKGKWARETIAQSMNRAIINSTAEYVAIWNIDDMRTPDSLETQVSILESNPNISLVYGDFVKVLEYGSKDGDICFFPQFDKSEFMRSCIGGFHMFRKSECKKYGFFDEQLRSGADFDLFVRIAANKMMCKAPNILGYFLDSGPCSSASNSNLQPIERTLIELRYGIYDKIDNRYVNDAQKYKVEELFFCGTWHSIRQYIANYDEYIKEKNTLQKSRARNNRQASIIRTIESFKCFLKKVMRKPLESLGVYEKIIDLIQKRPI
jgi:hypothetical protein